MGVSALNPAVASLLTEAWKLLERERYEEAELKWAEATRKHRAIQRRRRASAQAKKR